LKAGELFGAHPGSPAFGFLRGRGMARKSATPERLKSAPLLTHQARELLSLLDSIQAIKSAHARLRPLGRMESISPKEADRRGRLADSMERDLFTLRDKLQEISFINPELRKRVAPLLGLPAPASVRSMSATEKAVVDYATRIKITAIDVHGMTAGSLAIIAPLTWEDRR
jgi:hypothetical protein